MSEKEIKSIKCARVEKINGKNLFILAITWSDGPARDLHYEYIGRLPIELTEFRQGLNLKVLLSEDSSKISTVTMPELQLKEKSMFGKNHNEKNKKTVDEFFQHFLKLPNSILTNPDVVKFFSYTSSPTEDGLVDLLKRCDKSVRRPSTPDNNNEIETVKVPNSPKEKEKYNSCGTYEEIPENAAISRMENPVVIGDDDYAEVIVPGSTNQINSTSVAESEESDSAVNRDLYASVRKLGKPTVINSLATAQEDDYADTTTVLSQQGAPQKLVPPPSDDLYAEIGQDAISDEKPALPSPTSKPSHVKSKSISTPLTPIPPMPQFAPPTLGDAESSDTVSTSSDPGEIQIMALADYRSTTDGVLSFSKGSLGTMICQSDSNWWCIKLGTTNGWVPADYWKMLNEGDCAVLSTKSGAPWFVGILSRAECESLLMSHGKQQDFVVRESDKGHYALSVKYNHHIHHFPIQLTEDKKYNIGKHDFKTVFNIISYYKKNALFYDENNKSVSLGSPLVILKH